jgi:hypothetical protein
MKKRLMSAAVAVAVLSLTACKTTMPVAISSNPVGSKIGSSKTTSILGFFFDGGDASILTAAKNGKISKISTVDFKVNNVFMGIIVDFETIISGE